MRKLILISSLLLSGCCWHVQFGAVNPPVKYNDPVPFYPFKDGK